MGIRAYCKGWLARGASYAHLGPCPYALVNMVTTRLAPRPPRVRRLELGATPRTDERAVTTAGTRKVGAPLPARAGHGAAPCGAMCRSAWGERTILKALAGSTAWHFGHSRQRVYLLASPCRSRSTRPAWFSERSPRYTRSNRSGAAPLRWTAWSCCQRVTLNSSLAIRRRGFGPRLLGNSPGRADGLSFTLHTVYTPAPRTAPDPRNSGTMRLSRPSTRPASTIGPPSQA